MSTDDICTYFKQQYFGCRKSSALNIFFAYYLAKQIRNKLHGRKWVCNWKYKEKEIKKNIFVEIQLNLYNSLFVRNNDDFTKKGQISTSAYVQNMHYLIDAILI